MKKILYVALFGAVVLTAAGMNCPAQESNNITAVSSETGKVVMDSETAKIAAEWRKQNVPPPEVIQAAKEGYPLSLPDEDNTPKEWGVTGKALRSASLGEPFQKHTITRDLLRNYRKGDTIGTIVSETNVWQFPVMVSNKIKLSLMVRKTARGWEAVRLGGGPVEKELNKIVRQWPKSKGYNPVLIEVRGGGYFFTVPEKDSYNLTLIPIMPYEKKRTAYSSLDTVDDILKWLIPQLEETQGGGIW